MRSYPTISDVYTAFCPKNWGKAQRSKNELAQRPCITLGQLDDLYGVKDAARIVVKENLGGIYSLGMNRETMNQETATTVADLFVARYGGECTMFALMVYFSGYTMDYKGTYANYDVQDILLQFSKKFLPWWRQKQGMAAEPKAVEVPTGPCGMEGLKVYLRDKAYRGEDLRSGGLYARGVVNEALIQEVEAEIAAGVF